MSATVLFSCSVTPEKPTTTEKIETKNPQIETIADKKFSADTFYSLLVAEIALDRQRIDIAKSNYIQQAQQTSDLSVIARAARIANVIRDYDNALDLSRQWVAIDNHNLEAKLIFVSSLINTNAYIEAFDESIALAELGENTAFYDIAVKSAEEKSPLIDELAAKYAQALMQFPKDDELITGYSIILQAQGEYQKAMQVVDRSIQLNPNEIRHSYQKSRLLQATGQNQSAIDMFAAMVERYPENGRLRLRYASLLIRQDTEKAQQQYQTLHESQPDDPDILLTLALVQQKNKQLEAAKLSFKKLILMNQRVDEAHFGLGQIALELGDTDQAVEYFDQVQDGSRKFRSVNAIAQVTYKQQGLDAARTYLKNKSVDFDEEGKNQLVLAEADMVYDTGDIVETENIYNRALQRSPNSAALLYSRALLFSENDKLEEAESDFLKIIEMKPDDAAVLNAWGYTLADKTTRYSEAREYIQKAYSLQPNDAAILDSMGWVEYKLGNFESALDFLKKAMALMPDDEVAAHLGEVLWQMGQIEEARAAWERGLEIDSASKHVIETMKRLKANNSQTSVLFPSATQG